MATARKPTPRRRKPTPRKSSSNPAWLPLVLGVVIGLGVAGLVWLLLPTPGEAPTAPKTPTASKSTPKPATPKPASGDAPDYTFYTVLPQSEVRVPDDAKPAPKPAATGERFVLQIGSFRQAADADRRRAELILTGFDAFVEEAKLNAGETWHRVFVGPFNSQEAAQQARGSLSRQGIESLLLKRNDP